MLIGEKRALIFLEAKQKGHVVWGVQIYSVMSGKKTVKGKKRRGWSAAVINPTPYHTSLLWSGVATAGQV